MTIDPMTTDHMTTDHAPSETVPFWHYESPLRQRITGRYVRRASLVLAAINLLLIAALVG